MKTKRLLLGTLIAGILTIIFGGKAFATAGNTAEISGDKTWSICVDAGSGYAGSDFAVNITKTDFTSQIVLGNGDCKAVKMAAGTYTVSLDSAMGVGVVSYETANDTLTFSVANSLRKYLNTFGSIAYTVEGAGEESPFELLFSMPGECQFNGNANVSGETCKDGDGNPLTNKKYIDTNVALFSEENAGRDFEVYFTLTDYASTQPQNQATLFNAKYENSSMYYPGFTLRTLSNNGDTLQLTGRYGKDNTDADKANINISGTSIKGKEVKIVRVDGMVSYSIDGGELIPFQNYKNFSRYFNQTAVFGASMQTNGTPQRYFDGTIKDIRVYLKKVPVETTGSIEFQANGGTGSMATIEGIEVGTDVVLPMSTLSMNNANFTGWNTKSNGTGTAYADGATVTIGEVGKLKLYAQWEGTSIAVLDRSTTVNPKMKSLANSKTVNYVTDDDSKIKAIKSADTLPDNFDVTNRKNIISAGGDVSPLPIYAWFDDSDRDGDGKGDGVIYVYSIATKIYFGQYACNMFMDMKSLTDINELAEWDTSNVEDLGWIFYGDETLTDISALADWDVSNVVEMGFAFSGAKMLSDISPLAYWDTKNVETIDYMFDGTAITNVDALETKQHEGKDYTSWSIDSLESAKRVFADSALMDISALESWDVSHLANMSSLFVSASQLEDFSPIREWNTSNVTDMSDMFGDTAIVDISVLSTKQYAGNDYVSWDVSNVNNMSRMFSGCEKLSNLAPIANWDISSVTNMSEMFAFMPLLTSFPADLSGWDTSNVTNMSSLFGYSYYLSDISGLSGWNVSSVENMGGLFDRCDYLTNVNALANWDTSNLQKAYMMFYSADSLSDISGLRLWNTSNLKDMNGMFYGAAFANVEPLATKQHEGKNYVSWNVSNVEDMSSAFAGNKNLTDLSGFANWNTSKVKDMHYMFAYDKALVNLSGLEGWDVSSVENISDMFSSNEALVDITALSDWNTVSLKDMRFLFEYDKSIVDISALKYWNTSNVTYMSGVFEKVGITNVDALETKQHEGRDYISWDTSKVRSMWEMFRNASHLSDISALSSWDTSSVSDMGDMFDGASSIVSLSPIYNWSVANVSDMSDMFDGIPTSIARPSWYQE